MTVTLPVQAGTVYTCTARLEYLDGTQVLRRLRDMHMAWGVHTECGEDEQARAVAQLMDDILGEASREALTSALLTAVVLLGLRL